MKDVRWAGPLPPCDTCGAAGCGAYNSPIRQGSRIDFRASWANMCGPCFQRHGVDSSVTERRVPRAEPPREVRAIAVRWCGEEFTDQQLDNGTWRVRGADDETYDVYPPGAEFPCFEDDGRPCGSAVFPGEWCVRPLHAAPDDWFTVKADGSYRSPEGREAKVW